MCSFKVADYKLPIKFGVDLGVMLKNHLIIYCQQFFDPGGEK